MKLVLAAALLAAAACRKPSQASYKHCLTLRLGMPREALLKVMGPPADVTPYVEGRSLPHMKGLTAYEWPNGGSIPAPNYASVDDATGKVRSVRCSDVVITASRDL